MERIDIRDILNQCFWDYNYKIEDIENIIATGKMEQKLYLLKKIIANHNFYFKAAQVFPAAELTQLLANIPDQAFRHEFQNIRLTSLKNYFLGEKNAPERLRWALP
jgi:hypothetical protein